MGVARAMRGRTGRGGGEGRPSGRRGGPGFTAIELLTAFVLLALIAAVAWPALARARARWTVLGARDAFAATHARARLTALNRGRTVQVRLDGAGRRVELWVVGGDPSDLAPLREHVLDLGAEFPGVRIESNRAVLCFGARGLPVVRDGCDLPNATLVFRSGAVAETATVSLAGRWLER